MLPVIEVLPVNQNKHVFVKEISSCSSVVIIVRFHMWCTVLTKNIVPTVTGRGRGIIVTVWLQVYLYMNLQEKSNFSPAVGRVPTSINNN